MARGVRQIEPKIGGTNDYGHPLQNVIAGKAMRDPPDQEVDDRKQGGDSKEATKEPDQLLHGRHRGRIGFSMPLRPSLRASRCTI